STLLKSCIHHKPTKSCCYGVKMAQFPGQFRLEQRLKVKLGEAKNLIPRNHGSVGQRDIYCVISLDKEEIFRSATIEKTLE
ncbi:hypothetical protein Anas_07395, partial [Armadillidium nasatum]